METLQYAWCVIWQWVVINSGGVQAVGTIIAILIAIYVPWRQHKNDVERDRKQRLEERLLRMETAAAIAINAMNLIQGAWDSVFKAPDKTVEYYENWFKKESFDQAATALHEINVSDLPDWEMVRPILGLRDDVVRVAELVDVVATVDTRVLRTGKEPVNQDKTRKKLDKLYISANKHTTNIEALVNWTKDQR